MAAATALLKSVQKQVKDVEKCVGDLEKEMKKLGVDKTKMESSKDQLKSLKGEVKELSKSFTQLKHAANDIDISASRTASNVAKLKAEEKAVDSLRDAYIEEAAAQRLANRTQIFPLVGGRTAGRGPGGQFVKLSKADTAAAIVAMQEEALAAALGPNRPRSVPGFGGKTLWSSGPGGGRPTTNAPPGIPMGPATATAGFNAAGYGMGGTGYDEAMKNYARILDQTVHKQFGDAYRHWDQQKNQMGAAAFSAMRTGTGAIAMGAGMSHTWEQALAENARRDLATRAAANMESAYKVAPSAFGLGSPVNKLGRLGLFGSAEADAAIRRSKLSFGDGSTAHYGWTRNMSLSLGEQLAAAGIDMQKSPGARRSGGSGRGGGGGLFQDLLNGGGRYRRGRYNVPGPNVLAGILPGGSRARPAALALATGAALSLGPAAGPAIAGGALGLAAGAGALLGGFGTLKLAFAGITAEAFKTEKAFNKLSPTQKAFVQTLRSLDAGLGKALKGIAQQTVLGGFTKALHSAFTPASTSALAGGVGAFGGAISGGAQQAGKLFGSTGFAKDFGAVMQADARYLRDMLDGVVHLASAFMTLMRAAIPLTDWMDKGLLNLSLWTDKSIKAADSSGELSKFMDRARKSMEELSDMVYQVGRIFGAFFQAVGFKNSLLIIQDITFAFKILADLIFANKNVLQDFFGGALLAARDMLGVIQSMLNLLAPLLELIDRLVGGVKGWQQILDSIAFIWVAKFALMQAATFNLRGELGLATGAVGTLRRGLAAMAGKVFTVGLVLSLIPPSGVGQHQLDQVGLGWVGHLPVVGGTATQVVAAGANVASKILGAPSPKDLMNMDAELAFMKANPGRFTNYSNGTSTSKDDYFIDRHTGAKYTWAQIVKNPTIISPNPAVNSAVSGPGKPKNPYVNLSPVPVPPINPFGTPPALTADPAIHTPFTGMGVLPKGMRDRIMGAQTRIAQYGSITKTSAFNSDALRAAIGLSTQLSAAQVYLASKVKDATLNDRQHNAVMKEQVVIARQLADAQKKVGYELQAQFREKTQAKMLQLAGLGPGATSVPAQRVIAHERATLISMVKRLSAEQRAAMPHRRGVRIPHDPFSALPGAANMTIPQLIQGLEHAGVKFTKAAQKDFKRIASIVDLAKKTGQPIPIEAVNQINAWLKQIADNTNPSKLTAHPNSYRFPSIKELMKGLKGSFAVRHALAQRLAEVELNEGKTHHGQSAFGYPGGTGLGTSLGGHGRYMGRTSVAASKLGSDAGQHVVVQHNTIHVHGYQKDERVLAKEIHTELSKQARRNSTQTRGPNAGRNRNLN